MMTTTKPVEIVEADLTQPAHQQDIVELIDAYARDPLGHGQPLGDQVRRNLVPALRQHPTTYIFLAYQEGRACGIAVCFLGFSTFAAQPLLNIHDLAVLPEYRGQGTGQCLLEEVDRKARELGCCKLTLEVLANNHRARHVYEMSGFAQPQYVEGAGEALFLTKSLSQNGPT